MKLISKVHLLKDSLDPDMVNKNDIKLLTQNNYIEQNPFS